MDGHYLNKIKQYEMYISSWIEKTKQNELWNKYCDLHIDEIDPKFRDKQFWVDSSLTIYNLILKIIDSEFYRCYLIITLSNKDEKTFLNELTWEYIKGEIDLTPPSFYLFPRGNEIYEQTVEGLELVESLSKTIGHDVFFKEEVDENEYSRIIYIISQ